MTEEIYSNIYEQLEARGGYRSEFDHVNYIEGRLRYFQALTLIEESASAGTVLRFCRMQGDFNLTSLLVSTAGGWKVTPASFGLHEDRPGGPEVNDSAFTRELKLTVPMTRYELRLGPYSGTPLSSMAWPLWKVSGADRRPNPMVAYDVTATLLDDLTIQKDRPAALLVECFYVGGD